MLVSFSRSSLITVGALGLALGATAVALRLGGQAKKSPARELSMSAMEAECLQEGPKLLSTLTRDLDVVRSTGETVPGPDTRVAKNGDVCSRGKGLPGYGLMYMPIGKYVKLGPGATIKLKANNFKENPLTAIEWREGSVYVETFPGKGPRECRFLTYAGRWVDIESIADAKPPGGSERAEETLDDLSPRNGSLSEIGAADGRVQAVKYLFTGDEKEATLIVESGTVNLRFKDSTKAEVSSGEDGLKVVFRGNLHEIQPLNDRDRASLDFFRDQYSAPPEFPTRGLLAFYSADDASGLNSEINLYDFASARFVSTRSAFGAPDVDQAMNPVVSGDGQHLLFSGVQRGVPAGGSSSGERHCFLVDLQRLAASGESALIDGSVVRNLTMVERDGNFKWEDPSFLTDELFIAKKTNKESKGLVVVDLAGRVKAGIKVMAGGSKVGVELSKPVLATSNGQDVIVCSEGLGADARLVRIPIDLKAIQASPGKLEISVEYERLRAVLGSGSAPLADHYPVVVPDQRNVIIFTRWRGKPGSSGNDQIAMVDLDSGKGLLSPINDPSQNFSDPMPLAGGDLFFFSKTGGKTSYDIYLGRVSGSSEDAKPLTSLRIPGFNGNRKDYAPFYCPAGKLW